METELSGGVGWDFRKMVAQLMKWSDAALMDYGGKSGGGEKEERKACEEKVVEWGVKAEHSTQRSLETLLIADFFRCVSD